MNKLTIDDISLKGKRVLIRVDFNVPMENGMITDDLRIVESLPTIKRVISNGGKAVLVSHLGRPKGKVVDSLRMEPVAVRLKELLNIDVKKLDDCIGENVEKVVNSMKDGEVVLLENVRFHPEEEKNDMEFAKKIANFTDVYVNDAFGTAHRAHASTYSVAKLSPMAVAGYLMVKEIKYLGEVLYNPQKPFLAILGGAKVSTKIGVIKNLLDKVDSFIIGPAMCYTFLLADNKSVGNSLVETDKKDLAVNIVDECKKKNIKISFPKDHIVVKEKKEGASMRIAGKYDIKDGDIGVDIGPSSIEDFRKIIKESKTILWNGPVGVFEINSFAKGSYKIANAIAESSATSIIGGGDTAAVVKKCGLSNKMTHVSTGGGASLEFLEGKTLPGIAALSDKK